MGERLALALDVSDNAAPEAMRYAQFLLSQERRSVAVAVLEDALRRSPGNVQLLLMLADIHPGVRVLESGVGSGALSMTMLRAGAHVVGYELREDFAARAQKNVAKILGEEALSRYSVELRDAYEGIDETEMDRVVLDLPEPWQVVPHAAKALRTGGIILAYTPSIIQVSRFREALAEHSFAMAQTTEVMNRGWHVEGHAVRPDHRMVGHTGFLTTARLLEKD